MMKLLTANSTGTDIFGGIHTRKTEQIRYSPNVHFHLIELNSEKRYIPQTNCTIHLLDSAECTSGLGLKGVLQSSSEIEEFDSGIEKLVNEFQNVIRDENPDIILIPGTSLTGYILFKAAKRESILNRTIQEYSGVLEKELGDYSGNERYILEQVGKSFVSPQAREKVFYIFPSDLCKKTVEEIHGIAIPQSQVIWNGVSKPFLSGSLSRKVPEEITLGYVGRIHHVKNLPFFLDINSQKECERIKLKIITDLSLAAKRSDGKLLLRKLTEGRVYFYAPRQKNELADFYATQLSASVVSSFFETYCNGAVESLVSGTPCLLSDRAGAREVFYKYDLSQLVFSIEDMSSFNRALSYAENIDFTINPSLSKEIYEELSWKKVISRYNNVLERVISSQRQ